MDYNSKKWKRKRKYILKKFHFICQENKRYGKTVEAKTVHHIYPVEQYPELAYVDWNLLPVTNEAHNTFHDRENDEMTEKGKFWQRRRKKEFEKFKSPPIKKNKN